MSRQKCSFVSLIEELAKWFDKAHRVVVVGVGNPIRKDDNIGVEIVSGLEGKVPESVFLIKSETVPEESIGPIVAFRPTHILIIDAALLNLSPGSAKLVEPMEASGAAVSTHFLPIQIFCEYLSKMTSAKILMLLIQPKDTSFGEGLTPELESAKEKMVGHLVRAIKSAQN